tara:strand:+ start:4006 stop:4221 length:216 start_codon:yes stop_codon:yes gene_type:complete
MVVVRVFDGRIFQGGFTQIGALGFSKVYGLSLRFLAKEAKCFPLFLRFLPVDTLDDASKPEGSYALCSNDL